RHPAGERHHLGAARDGEESSNLGCGESGRACGVVAVPRVEVGALGACHHLVRSICALQGSRSTSAAPAPRGCRGRRRASGYARKSARSASSAGFGLAPMTRLTTSPVWKTYIAGIEVMPYFMAVSGLSSTLSLTIEIFSACSSAILSRMGDTARHGPHQGAQKSTMIGFSDARTSSANVASVTSLVDMFFLSVDGWCVQTATAADAFSASASSAR